MEDISPSSKSPRHLRDAILIPSMPIANGTVFRRVGIRVD
jgi:hypothetical protein